MMETLWAVCAWTGFVWWCCFCIAATVVVCAKLVESWCVRWEEGELRRIAVSIDDLPENWRELDAYHSWLDATAEMRRKAGGA